MKKKMFIKSMLLAVIMLVVGNGVAWGQTAFTATYTFGSNGNVASFNYNGTTYAGISMGAMTKTGVSTSSSTDNFRATTWPTAASVDAAKYIGFTISAASGYKFTVNTITFGVGRSGTGTRNTVWRGSSDSYGALINNYTALNAGITNNSGVLNNPDATTAYTGNVLTLSSDYTNITTSCGFRMYMYSAEASGGTAGLAGPITITGTFETAVSSYTVSYNTNGGTGTMSDVSSPYTSSSTVTVKSNEFSRTGYTFAGWNTVANGSGTAYSPAATFTIAANTTLYAQWTANNNTVTFDGNTNTGGSMSAQTIATDASANLTSNGFTKTGYTFAGWATSAGGVVAYANAASYTMGTGNVTLYAKWTPNNNTITFNGNGSDGGSMSNQTIATDASANLTSNAFTRTGYSFNGWNTALDGSGTSYANGANYSMGTSSVTLYAQWLVISTPTINVTGSLSAVSSTYGTASSATSFSVSGSALTDNILITPPSGFEVSQTSGGATGYAATQTLTHSGGTVSSTNIYVRLAATTTPASYSGNVVMSSSGATSQNAATISSTVSAKQLNVSGLSIASTKVYDGTTAASVTGTPSLLSSIASGSSVSSDGKPITGDAVSLSGTASGVYNSKDVAAATTASISGLSLTGAQSAYYTLNQGSAAATISAKNLSMSGLSIPASKTYDGTTTAVVSGTATLQLAEAPGAGTTDDGKPYTGDVVSIQGTATGTYNDANVASATTVTFGGLSLTGAQSANYSFTIQSPQAATITKANQTITLAGTATKYVGDADYTLAATSATSETNPLSYSSSNTAVATINASSGLVQILSSGSTTITVSQAGNANYNAATNATQTLTVNAEQTLLLSEDFNYTDATVLTATTTADPTTGWLAHSGNGTANIDVTVSGLSFNGYVGSGKGGAAKVDNNGQDINKPFGAKTSGIIYVASIIKIIANTTAGYFFNLGPNVIGSTYFSRVWVNATANGINITTGSSAPSSYISITNSSPFVLVLKHNFTTHKTDMFILNSFSTTEPTTPSVTIDETLTEIGSVALRQYSSAQNILVDGIRVTTSWSDLALKFTGTGEWTSNGNWNTGSAPASDAQVVIDGDITINSSVTAGNITINSGKSLTVNAGKQLTISTGIVNNGTLLLKSDATGTASLIDSYTVPTIAATVQQYVTAGRNWYMSAPVSAAAYTSLSGGTSVVEWNEVEKRWDNVTTGNLVKGKGYIQVAASTAGTTGAINFTGTTNSGDITVGLTRTESGSNRGFNLVGNPYPSYLSWTEVAAANTGVLPTAWFRTKAGNVYKNATVNVAVPSSPVIVDNGVNTTITTLIPPMQAYWVRVNAELTSTNYTVTNTMREHIDNAGNRLKAPKVNETKLIRLLVSNGTNTDEAVVYFNNNASNAFDRYDSPKMFNSNTAIPEIYTQIGSDKLVINGMNAIPFDTELPLGFYAGAEGIYNLKANELLNLENVQIILKDGVTEFDLTNGNAYEFNSTISNNNTRFSLIFRTSGSVNGLDNTKLDTSTSAFVNANGELVIKTSAPLSANATVSIFNAIGQKISSQPITTGMSISNVSRTAGVYWVKLTSDGEVVTRKVVVK